MAILPFFLPVSLVADRAREILFNEPPRRLRRTPALRAMVRERN